MKIGLLYSVIALLAGYQLYVTLRVTQSVLYSQRQKLIQALLIWLIPVLGALVCHIVLISDTRQPKARDIAFTPDGGGNPSGIGPTDGHF